MASPAVSVTGPGTTTQHALDGLRRAIVAQLGNAPSPERRPYLLSPILFPIEEPPAEAAGHPE